jgi:hypothetical protein
VRQLAERSLADSWSSGTALALGRASTALMA